MLVFVKNVINASAPVLVFDADGCKDVVGGVWDCMLVCSVVCCVLAGIICFCCFIHGLLAWELENRSLEAARQLLEMFGSSGVRDSVLGGC